ncbi:uncharacterized protein GGS25DRAFT_487731 [Hypoxylon fragiforme]|uniref:uncharacterized protein n=1 Tax=Hypoxylon fragiforme TaxID=63214 RepID=UPI0020C70657|nr:uncharacterized protein GGS25DRAFT_487731 [Hypoxylon fragiforme]KAI2610149.1 hypothetical protein GGS25DRAFT_487731 [Hypoxylon fragiforme]
MPQDPNLYGQRPSKRQKKEIPLSSSLDFTSQLSSLLSTSASNSASPSSVATSGRLRPSKNKDDIFSVKAKRKAGASAPGRDGDDNRSRNRNSKDGAKISLKDVRGTEEEKQDHARARRKMEEKARLYAAMKRGDYIAKEGETAPLVDFDRKWAETHPGNGDAPHQDNSSSGSDNDSDEEEADNEMVEFKDEFGRTRRATRTEALRLERQRHRSALGAAELESMAAKPTRAPERLIFGDVIQSAAFNPEHDTLDRMADLAAKRDKEPTPPPDTHFDGAAEIRTKGVGFYQFSQDSAARREEMQNLSRERETTERVRRDREKAREDRRREIEERRRRIGAKRAEKMAENFLDGLAGAMAGGGGSGDFGSGSGMGDAPVDDGKKQEETKEE